MRIPRIRRPRLTYANVAATLALVLTVSMGGAYAHHGLIGPKEIKKNAVKSRHIGWHQVKTGDLGKGSVTTRKLRNGNVKRPDLARHVVPASAHAHVEASGSVNENLSKNITDANVTHPAEGVYCVRNLSFPAVNAVASGNFGGVNAAVRKARDSRCPNGTRFTIYLTRVDNGSAINSFFNVVFF